MNRERRAAIVITTKRFISMFWLFSNSNDRRERAKRFTMAKARPKNKTWPIKTYKGVIFSQKLKIGSHILIPSKRQPEEKHIK